MQDLNSKIIKMNKMDVVAHHTQNWRRCILFKYTGTIYVSQYSQSQFNSKDWYIYTLFSIYTTIKWQNKNIRQMALNFYVSKFKDTTKILRKQTRKHTGITKLNKSIKH